MISRERQNGEKKVRINKIGEMGGDGIGGEEVAQKVKDKEIKQILLMRTMLPGSRRCWCKRPIEGWNFGKDQ